MPVFDHNFDRTPNPKVDTYPQVGSEHNIKLIFELSIASRVGIKKIPRKNINGN